jgi:hypothetical protein
MPRGIYERKGVKPVAINVRVTVAQLAAFNRLGGPQWLRAQIDAAVAADRDLPTAHQPFPAFTVTDASGKPIPHSVTMREH